MTSWKGSNEDKASIKKQRASNKKKRRSDPDNSDKGNWQNKFKKSSKMQSGISHIMSIMIEEETNKSFLVVALQSFLPPIPSKRLFLP